MRFHCTYNTSKSVASTDAFIASDYFIKGLFVYTSGLRYNYYFVENWQESSLFIKLIENMNLNGCTSHFFVYKHYLKFCWLKL